MSLNLPITENMPACPLLVHADTGTVDQVLMNSHDTMPKWGQFSIETSAVKFAEPAACKLAQAVRDCADKD